MTALPLPLILFLLPDLGGGGAQRVMLQFAGALDPGRYETKVLVLGGSRAFAGDIPPHLAIESRGANRVRAALPWAIRRIKDEKPAAVVSVMGYVNLALLAAKPFLPKETRIIVREANVVSATLAGLPRLAPGKMLYRQLYPRASRIITPTRAIGDEIARAAPRAVSRIALCPNPVDEQGIRAKASNPHRDPGPGLRIVAAGRLTHQKGFDRLIPLLTRLPSDTRLTIYGDGPDRAALEALAQTSGLGGRVTCANFSTELPSAVAGADVFALPSRWEGLPNVVLEALAVGTPVLASGEASVADIAKRSNPGALTIEPVGESFAAALARFAPKANAIPTLRLSLLPPDYRRETACARFAAILEETLNPPQKRPQWPASHIC